MVEDAMDIAQQARTRGEVLGAQMDLMRLQLNRHMDDTNTGLQRLHERIDSAQKAWWGAALTGLLSLVATLANLLLRIH